MSEGTILLRSKPQFRFGRRIVSTLYVMAITLQLLAINVSEDSRSLGVLALTAAYAILMFLLWLYERFPPALGTEQGHRSIPATRTDAAAPRTKRGRSRLASSLPVPQDAPAAAVSGSRDIPLRAPPPTPLERAF